MWAADTNAGLVSQFRVRGVEMDCPECNATMDQGSAEVPGSILGFLSAEQLWFFTNDGRRMLVTPGHLRRAAHRCPHCGMLALEGASE